MAFEAAVRAAVKRLEGAYAIYIMKDNAGRPDDRTPPRVDPLIVG